MDISAVIATRNRTESLYRLLKSLHEQSFALKEVIIVDASDSPLLRSTLQREFPALHITYTVSAPSVCKQRNEGIRLASSSHILLCDDDLEFPKNYLQTVAQLFESNSEYGAISGLCLEPDVSGSFKQNFPTITFGRVVWNSIFQLTVWADLEQVHTNWLGKPLLSFLRKYYRKKGNAFSSGGWPLVTQTDRPHFRTSLYSLGGTIVRRDWLLQSPYDELLDKHGIGDHYGVALHFPQKEPILVTQETHVFHHKIDEHRLPKELSYYRRILALDYFMTQSEQFTWVNRLILLWSLLGNFIPQFLQGQSGMMWATMKAISLILTLNNPYTRAYEQGLSHIIAPAL